MSINIESLNYGIKVGINKKMIYNFLSDYLSIIIFLFIALFLSIGFIVANFLASPSNPIQKNYLLMNVDFDAFDDSRMEFDVRFYLVAILFIIFDLEIAFLFPWAISLGSLGALGFWSMMIFLAILTIGFIYEWKKRGIGMGINFNLNADKQKSNSRRI